MASAVFLRAAVALTGRFPVLAGIDLTVAPGEIVVLEGPNGAGKTSVLRACAGLLPVTSGEAVVLGHDLRRNACAVRRQVGMLGHAAALYDELNVVENIRFAVRAAGAGVDGIDAALDRLGLVGRLRRTAVGRLSAGQRRRVALAVLVARRPALWLLDEPHAALDADARALLGDLINEAVAGGATVLLASHEPEASLPLADRAVSLAGGRVVDERSLTRRRAPAPSETSMWRDALLVAGKDLRIELRSRVVLNQVAPFAIVVLALFAFALGPEPRPHGAGGGRPVLGGRPLRRRPGRPAELRPGGHRRHPRRPASVGSRPGRRSSWARRPPSPSSWSSSRFSSPPGWCSSTAPTSIPTGRFWSPARRGRPAWPPWGRSTAPWPPGCASARRLLPFLLLPVVAPVLLAGTRAWQVALGTGPGGDTADPWLRLMLVFAAVYLALGVMIFGPLQEAS